MDNFFEILIYILIIVSFISSFLKKKPQQKQTDSGQSDKANLPGGNIATPKVNESPKQDVEFDLANEIESFFNVGQPDVAQKKPTHQPEDKIKEEIKSRKDFIEVPEESFHKTTSSEHSQSETTGKDREDYVKVPEESFHKMSSSEHTFVDPWDKRRKEVEKQKKSIGSKVEQEAEKFEEYLEVRETAATDIIRTIKNRLKDPSSLKEYIIISEIIGKPKALR